MLFARLLRTDWGGVKGSQVRILFFLSQFVRDEIKMRQRP